MIRRQHRLWGLLLLGALLLGGAGWIFLERSWQLTPRATPEAARNRLLAARLFLQQQNLAVRQLPDWPASPPALTGTRLLLLPERPPHMAPAHRQALQQWVADGGTLVLSPLANGLADPLLAEFGLRLRLAAATKGPPLSFQPPASQRLLQLERERLPRLQVAQQTAAPRWQDSEGQYLRAYAHGQGQVIVLSRLPAWFDNGHLQQRDHAELLWWLSQPHGQPGEILIIHSAQAPRWYVRFWHAAPLGWLGLGVCLLLWLWHTLPRFGPLLPEAEPERRSLLEHIDACGRWLWQTDSGRTQLLQATRQAVQQRLQARMPEWSQLPPAELNRRISQRFDCPESAVDQALHQPVSPSPQRFTSQLRLLQILRKKL